MKKINKKSMGLDFNKMFSLRNNLDDNNIQNNLDDKNKIAIEIMDDVLKQDMRAGADEFSILNYIEETNSVMRWMLNSALYAKDMGNEYCEVIDIVAIFLIKVYRDYEMLPVVAELIFQRNRNDLYAHELIWAFFQSYDVDSLKFICDRLSSNDKKSKELACALLSFIPNINEYANNNKSFYAKKWIDNNKDYIFFTDDSKHARSNPVYCKLNLDGKYLGEIVNKKTGKIISDLENDDKKRLKEFKKLDENEKIILSSYSFKLKKLNLDKWLKWINYSINDQIAIAKGGILI